jgi:hypothetical protein
VSQYPYPPNPYVPPTVDYAGWPVPPRRDRNAGIAALLQLLMGGFLFLAGTCFTTAISKTDFSQIMAELQKQGANIPDIPGHDVVTIFRNMMIVFFVSMIVAGIVLLTLTPFVYRGRRGATMGSIALVGIIAVLVLLSIIAGLAQTGANPTLIFSLAALLYALATLVMQIQSLRTAADPRAQAAMQQAWYWLQQQQNGSAYGQGYGYGTGYPAPPPIPGAPPPPPSEPQNPPAPPSA